MFLHQLRSEFKVHYAAFCNSTTDAALRSAVDRGIISLCNFVVRVYEMFFSPLSGVDVFLEAPLVSGGSLALRCDACPALKSSPSMFCCLCWDGHLLPVDV